MKTFRAVSLVIVWLSGTLVLGQTVWQYHAYRGLSPLQTTSSGLLVQWGEPSRREELPGAIWFCITTL